MEWIKVEYHKVTDKEREELNISDDITYYLDCVLPHDSEQILIARKWKDEYITEVDECLVDEGYYLDSGTDWREVTAWMPMPQYK